MQNEENMILDNPDSAVRGLKDMTNEEIDEEKLREEI
jgi:hypothetical protein